MNIKKLFSQMAKTPTSAIGLDIGRHSLKAALLRKSNGALILENYAILEHVLPLETAEQLSEQITGVLKKLGASAPLYAISATAQNAILMIISHKDAEKEKLRASISARGASYFNDWEPGKYVIDCAALSAAKGGMTQYLLTGMTKKAVATVADALQKSRVPVGALQLGPVSSFNAFQHAMPKTFSSKAFLLLDIGHCSSAIIGGSKGEMVAVKVNNYGGKAFVTALEKDVAKEGAEQVLALLERKDARALDSAKSALYPLLRDLSAMVNDVESRCDEPLEAVYVSGMLSKSPEIRSLISSELRQRPCNQWDPFAKFNVSLPPSRKAAFQEDRYALNVACGAAATVLGEK
jgi:Tfp pilus assembly PilM family ATPase